MKTGARRGRSGSLDKGPREKTRDGNTRTLRICPRAVRAREDPSLNSADL